MRSLSCLLVIGVAIGLAGCDERQATQENSSPTTFQPSTEPSAAGSPESPKETAESAAAAAPECKEISETKPGACDPAATRPSHGP